MKCIICINVSLVKAPDVSTDVPVQTAVDGAKDAVTVRNGEALCVEHLHQRTFEQGYQDFMNAVEKSR